MRRVLSVPTLTNREPVLATARPLTAPACPFPYGIKENRTAWERMALCTRQQGIARRQFTPEEIFPAGIMTSAVI